ncbi:SDR family oxidoreductase [Simiduia sp. 21SJ11W-1]|uniref:SDR family oxidoreductase n=1 Tax=Simiduia sp. 21SJ11W-1 TaxID=2909669 RepID=UPI0020A15902|nr:SDR family oxidoreductase [Simiduia sp. 21SJ11W-1]UTA47817.1 SDR family oxidoreductase [Simiduia sp. 21SJ11W-1]
MTDVIYITGASSGLGRQMAIEFARRGHKLALTARRLENLHRLKTELVAETGVEVWVGQLDVTDAAAVSASIQAAHSHFGRLDKVIANAGVGYSQRVGRLAFELAKATIDTNVTGLMATVDAAVRLFKQQGCGHIVAIGSVAGFRGLPGAAVYSASKAAVTTYMQALRAELHRHPIDVTVLWPGYIDTPINQSARSRPFEISVELGGRLLANLIEARVTSATVPRWPWALVARVLRIVPTGLLARFG